MATGVSGLLRRRTQARVTPLPPNRQLKRQRRHPQPVSRRAGGAVCLGAGRTHVSHRVGGAVCHGGDSVINTHASRIVSAAVSRSHGTPSAAEPAVPSASVLAALTSAAVGRGGGGSSSLVTAVVGGAGRASASAVASAPMASAAV